MCTASDCKLCFEAGQLIVRVLIVQFSVRLPLPTPSNLISSRGNRTPSAGRYMLTYMDEDTLIGRAQTGAGVFIFQRADEPLDALA